MPKITWRWFLSNIPLGTSVQSFVSLFWNKYINLARCNHQLCTLKGWSPCLVSKHCGFILASLLGTYGLLHCKTNSSQKSRRSHLLHIVGKKETLGVDRQFKSENNVKTIGTYPGIMNELTTMQHHFLYSSYKTLEEFPIVQLKVYFDQELNITIIQNCWYNFSFSSH